MSRSFRWRILATVCLSTLLWLVACEEAAPPTNTDLLTSTISPMDAQATRFAQQRQALVERGVIAMGVTDDDVIATLRQVYNLPTVYRGPDDRSGGR